MTTPGAMVKVTSGMTVMSLLMTYGSSLGYKIKSFFMRPPMLFASKTAGVSHDTDKDPFILSSTR